VLGEVVGAGHAGCTGADDEHPLLFSWGAGHCGCW
jgi:hypothetical protein